jgi:hypothetical protein
LLAAAGVDTTRDGLWHLTTAGAVEHMGTDGWPALEVMQARVGGYVEHVAVSVGDRPAHLLLNEDGRAMRLPVNALASAVHAEHHLRQLRAYERLDLGARRALTRALDVFGDVLLWVGHVPPDA